MKSPPYLDSFRCHDQEGIPLSVSIQAGGERVNLLCFYFDALAAGWIEGKAVRVIREARADNGLIFQEEEMRRRVLIVWTSTPKPRSFAAAKDFLVKKLTT